MKRRILFVDDEALVLQGLQRMLRSMRDQWDMEFVGSGEAALNRMAQAPFHAIVSDMMMPGLNGADLLNEVMARHPNTVRLILSGHADRDLILKCVGSTHQYLSKPCNAEALKATLTRATSLVSSSQNDRLMALIARVKILPSLPSLYIDIFRCLRSPDVSMEEVGAIMAKDIAMTAKILKLVNSAFFGLGRRISSPAEAASYLGADIIKSLVLSTKVFSQFQAATVGDFSVEALWQHSLRTASTARLIAKTEHAGHALIDEAFCAGLLHDTGKLILAANFSEQYREALAKMTAAQLSSCDAEQEVFGCSHAEVGGYLLGLWGLPVPVVEAITLHHLPASDSKREFSALTATCVANALVHEPEATAELEPYLSRLGLNLRLPIWKLALQESSISKVQSL